MKTIKQIFVITVLLRVILFIEISDSIAQNLVLNPGCEDSLINGEIPHWEEIVGSNWTQRRSNPLAFEGESYFFPGAALSAELRQDIDVSDYAENIDNNNQSFEFNGYVRSYPQSPQDYSRIVLEYLDASNTTILYTFDSGDYSITSEWVLISETTEAPMGTRYIRIRLISTRRAGTNNDGYFDNLSLIIADPVIINGHEEIRPREPILSRNYPNPFNPITTIEYSIPDESYVSLKIYTVSGQLVATLRDEIEKAGEHSFTWNASYLPSGIYLYTLKAGNYVKTRKMTLVK